MTTTVREAMETYLALRRGLGAQLRVVGGYLHRFVEFLERQGATVVTTELALRWATSAVDATPATWARRLADVHRFAAWLSATDPRTQIPPCGLLPHRHHRHPPQLYTDDQIERLIHQAACLPSRNGLRGQTYATLFGLLAATGLRVGEAVALNRDDVDLSAGVLAVRRGKFGKSRLVPLHPSTDPALRRYAQIRDLLLPHPASPAFLLSERGLRLTPGSARYTFAVVSRAVGLRPAAAGHRHGRGPRLHDLRHRVAVETLVRWYRQGRDVERELPKLSTYLGHAQVADTYWYLEAIPELLQLATERAMGEREDRP